MSRVRQVAGGGRAVEVEPERLQGFLDRFATRHQGVTESRLGPTHAVFTAADGAKAELDIPFGGLPGEQVTTPGLHLDPLLPHLLRPRRIALVLVRLGGHSLGVAEGGKVVLSTTDRRQVHGRNKAGGWSQQRFARRREGQARVALQAAADDVFRVLVPQLSTVDAVVLGGDRSALAELRADRRIAALMNRAEERVLDVPEPRRTVLDEAALRARCVDVVVTEP
ncbi:acVLRF1 family peptidyl-tRNA hydrolase [Crossiella sp. CA-258035]|uniref:acVLRF1 family peptidyl-tRNA hydrolase n=1 Tax=Crossiella sp. CA-258035 TaxID=2981138 RepID=UPI0024BD06DA|nr:acVLRF1 family peptidyl-tRNA hydrolase [Crossiella sp. CA-258035]WHT23646.1 acVLRF1 family peptidyl-tRNA hydrolase [Crossiella sp. CA-258035]